MTMRDDQCSIRSIAERLGRSFSSISHERRRAPGSRAYDANTARRQSYTRRMAPRRTSKSHSDGALLQEVRHYLEELWSPQQIANILRSMWPDDSDKTVSHETNYNAGSQSRLSQRQAARPMDHEPSVRNRKTVVKKPCPVAAICHVDFTEPMLLPSRPTIQGLLVGVSELYGYAANA